VGTAEVIGVQLPAFLVALGTKEPRAPPTEGGFSERYSDFELKRLSVRPMPEDRYVVADRPRYVIRICRHKVVRKSGHAPSIANL
jgi:hypothetical protein